MRSFLLVAAIAGIACAIGCGQKFSTGVAIDSAFRPFLPPNATVLAGINVDKLKASPLYQRYENQLQGLNAWAERTGIDPRRDLSAVLLAASSNEQLALAKGRFTKEQLGPKLSSMGAQQARYKTYTLFGNSRESVVLLRDGLLAAGPVESLHRLIDRGDSASGGVPAPLQRRLSTLRKDDSLWLVSDGGLPLVGVPLRPDVQSALSNIEGFISGTTAGAAVDAGAHLKIDFDCISNEGAQRVHDALKGGIGLARLTTNDNALDMLRLYDSINVTKNSQLVQVKADLSGDLIDKVWTHLHQILDHANRALENGQ